MTVPDIPDIQEVYKSRTRIDNGTVGHLNDSQQQALKNLWIKIFAHFEATADKPIKVTHSQIKADSYASAGITGSDSNAVAQWYNQNLEQASNVTTQTVRDKMYLDGIHEAAVPGTFKPLFSNDRATRSFANTFWLACMLYSSPDSYLLMFLRSVSWDVEAAFEKIVKSVEWRASQAIDELMWDGELGQHHKMMSDGVTIRAGKDKLGYPVVIVRVRLNVPRERSESIVERFAAFSLEQTALLARGFGERATLVYDYNGFKKENIDLAFIKSLLTMLSESYPQMLSVTIQQVNSWLFTGFWTIIRSWLDPLIAKRTVIAKNVDQLQTFLDKDQIMADMGGELPYNYKYVYPTKKENSKMFDTEGRMRAETELKTTVDAFFAATKQWVASPDAASYLDPARVQAAAAFHAAALELDPYIRARFMTERNAE
ncbi:phosphatidylinositol transfer protein csr1 [Coemansia sp. RSA 1722]|nr:phosphatidylinositol transfer protein csr1 [Coemansia sp. RSA 485]KAJ2606593.1 phosphatidylinositol transfer protein csr1 [Coemansia sp. RSA 1722]